MADDTEKDVEKTEETFTQAQVNNIVSERLKKEREKYADYDDLKKQVGDYETKVNSLTADLEKQKSDYDAKIQSYEINSVKMKTALEKGLPMDLAERLQGNTEDEIRADAEKLANYAKPTTPPPFEAEPATETDPKRASLAKMLDSMKK
ncbi:MAG: DUF4355 domain-containing protein [Clostridia bacterium]|nr:DUF4355 domain-containing protein [Clostridia bacterium]